MENLNVNDSKSEDDSSKPTNSEDVEAVSQISSKKGDQYIPKDIIKKKTQKSNISCKFLIKPFN